MQTFDSAGETVMCFWGRKCDGMCLFHVTLPSLASTKCHSDMIIGIYVACQSLNWTLIVYSLNDWKQHYKTACLKSPYIIHVWKAVLQMSPASVSPDKLLLICLNLFYISGTVHSYGKQMRSGTARTGPPQAACLQFTTQPIKHLIWPSPCTSVPWHSLMVTIIPQFSIEATCNLPGHVDPSLPLTLELSVVLNSEQAWVCSTLLLTAFILLLPLPLLLLIQSRWVLQAEF